MGIQCILLTIRRAGVSTLLISDAERVILWLGVKVPGTVPRALMMEKKKVSPAQELDGVGTQRLKTLGLAGGRAKG